MAATRAPWTMGPRIFPCTTACLSTVQWLSDSPNMTTDVDPSQASNWSVA